MLKKIVFALTSIILILSFSGCSETEQKPAPVVKKRIVKKAGSFKNLTPQDFNKMLAEKPGNILDVRELDEAKHGIIEGAIIAPLYSDTFKDTIKMLDKNKPVYVYDGNGNLSVIAAKTLLSNNFQEIYSLMGGVAAWGMEGFDLVSPKIIKGEF